MGSALSEFHMLLLWASKLTAISVLDQRRTYEDEFDTKVRMKRSVELTFIATSKLIVHQSQLQRRGTAVGMCRDPVTGIVWVATRDGVIKYSPNHEHRYSKSSQRALHIIC